MRTMGRETEFDWLVTEFSSPSRMAIVSTAGIMPTRSFLDFTSVGEACRVSVTVEGSPGGMLRMVEPLIAESVRSTLAAGLARAQAALESPSG
jgi:hypothetical protein